MDGKKVGIGIGVVLLITIIVGLVVCFLLKGEEEIIYKVTFDNDGVTEIIDVKEADVVVKPIDPTKEGYTFAGWYYNGTKFDFTTGITKDITLKARWLETAAKKWVVKFDTAGGKYIENLDVIDGEKIEQIPTPVKDGYKFLGWFYNNEKFDFETTITKNITLVAKWEKVETKEETVEVPKYTVKFDADNGSKVVSRTVEKNKTVTKLANPIKEGYKFLGWYNGNVEFDFDTKITKDITLKAKWEKVETPVVPETPETYTVRFDADNGSDVFSRTIEKNETIAEPTNPIKEGYKFLGWYNGNVEFDFDTKITKDITLKAKWEKVETPVVPETPETYTVSFDLNGGDGSASEQNIEKGKTVSKPVDPTRIDTEGKSKIVYTFLGWYNGDKLFDFDETVKSNITLKARWTKKYEIKTVGDVGQVQVLLYKNDVIINGYADVTFNSGKVRTLEFSIDGKVVDPNGDYYTNGGNIKSIDNIKVK